VKSHNHNNKGDTNVKASQLRNSDVSVKALFTFSALNYFPKQPPLVLYSGRKITESLGNVTVRGEKSWKEQEGSAIINSLSEHVYYN
jgi:hypothetical protein